MKRRVSVLLAFVLCATVAALSDRVLAQEKQSPALTRDQAIAAAREIMVAQPYCALITIDDTGRAVLIDDMKEILARKRAYWDTTFTDLKDVVLIKVVPEEMDVVNYKRGALGDKVTWRAPTVTFNK